MYSDACRKTRTWAVVVVAGSMILPLLAGTPAMGAADAAMPGPGRFAGSAAPRDAETTAGPVTPEVRELSVPDVERPGHADLAARSAPKPVEGYGVVGATWRGTTPAGLHVAVRTKTLDCWSPWTRCRCQ